MFFRDSDTKVFSAASLDKICSVEVVIDKLRTHDIESTIGNQLKIENKTD